MIISLEEARKIMGEANKKYADKVLEEIIRDLIMIADLSMDSYLAKRGKKQ